MALAIAAGGGFTAPMLQRSVTVHDGGHEGRVPRLPWLTSR
jgi:hypothetical protein